MTSLQDQIVAHDAENLNGPQSYEQLLRAIGQALEKDHLQSFELTPVSNGFHIRGSAAPESPIKVQFTIQDIQQLEFDGRARRVDTHSMANPASVSQVLRCLGAYLKQKRARLLRLMRDGQTVSLEYETSLGSQFKEEFSAKDLYDMWVRMYMQRAGRLNH